jgi:hypothetical protein
MEVFMMTKQAMIMMTVTLGAFALAPTMALGDPLAKQPPTPGVMAATNGNIHVGGTTSGFALGSDEGGEINTAAQFPPDPPVVKG